MNWKRIAIAVVCGLLVGAAGVTVWIYTGDAGLVVSVAMASLYIVLFTLGLPRRHWVLCDDIEARIESEKDNTLFLNSPCRVGDPCPEKAKARSSRHVHFAEVLEISSSESLARKHGFLKLADVLVRDLKYQWLFGVLSTALMTLVFITISRSTGLQAGEFDPGRAAIAGVVGIFHMGTAAYGIVWFRKQAERL